MGTASYALGYVSLTNEVPGAVFVFPMVINTSQERLGEGARYVYKMAGLYDKIKLIELK